MEFFENENNDNVADDDVMTLRRNIANLIFNQEDINRGFLRYLMEEKQRRPNMFESNEGYNWCIDYTFFETDNVEVFESRYASNDYNLIINIDDGHDSEFRLDNDSKTKFMHDFTFKELFRDTTDVKVTELTARSYRNPDDRQSDSWNKQSPDLLYKDRQGLDYNVALVLEFFTSRKRNIQREEMHRLLMDKMGKYTENLKEICRNDRKEIFFGVIGVSERTVYSNFNITNLLGEEYLERLTKIKRTGTSLIDELVNIGWAMLQEEELLKTQEKCKENLKEIRFNWEQSERNFNYKEKNYKDWLKEYSEEEDGEFVRNLINGLTNKATDELNDNVTNIEEKNKRSVDEIRAFRRKFYEGDRRADTDMKTIVNMPFIVPKRTRILSEYDFTTKVMESCGDTDSTIARVWYSAAHCCQRRGFKFSDLTEDMDDFEVVNHFERLSKKNANKIYRNRVEIRLRPDDRLNLAKTGLNAKRMMKEVNYAEEIDNNKSIKKRPFTLNVMNRDIDLFIEKNNELFERNEINMNESETELLKKSSELHDDDFTNKLFELKEFWDNSNFASFTRLISLIGVEVTVSMKQFTKPGEFILKRLNDYDCYLLLSPTNQNGPIFFSLCFYKETFKKLYSEGKIFRELLDIGDFYFTEFVSLNRYRILNWVRCATSMANLNVFWNEIYKSEMTKVPERMFSNPESNQMMKLSFLTHMEDKSETEETMSLLRYICMKSFAVRIFKQRCNDMLKKFTTIPRSRLNVWVLNKIFFEMERINETGGYSRRGDGEYDNIRNPYTGGVCNVEQIINIFYIGYSRNKIKTSEKNAIGKLYKKILDKENLYEEDETTFGANMPVLSRQEHRWSISFVRLIIKEGKEFLTKTLGRNWEKNVEEDILRRMSMNTMDDLATLKASSSFDGSNRKYEVKGEGVYRRKKALKAISELVSNKERNLEEVLVSDYMKDSLEIICARGWMNIDIFEKMQYSGLREIYVLGIRERILQSLIESIAWVLCSKFPGEAMTNPKNKSGIIQSHSRSAYKNFKSPSTFCTSDDAAKWNQVHSVTKFCMLLINFTPEYMHPFIVRTCQLWQRRRVMIDPNIIHLFDKMDRLHTTDEVFQRMFDAYKGIHMERWLKPNNKYVQVSGGFMQGILHYTSSFCHVLYLEWWKKFCLRTCHKAGIKDVIIDYVASSDDSSALISFNSNNALDELKFVMRAWLFFNLKKQFGYHVGIQESEKSAKMTKEAIEFNSRFYFGANDMNAWIKSVISCNVIGQSSTLVGLQEETNTNIVNILMDGGSSIVSNMAELYCGSQYYMLLGNNITSHFNRLKRIWLNYHDPGVGFFLCSHPKSTLFGYSYNMYNLLTVSTVGRKYVELLTRSYARNDKELMMTAKGSINRMYMTTWGNHERLKRMMRELNLPGNWTESYDEHPSKLFEKPRTVDDIILKLAFKASSPGVGESLGQSANGRSSISAAVYIAVFNVFSMTNAFGEPNRDEFGNIKIPDYEKMPKKSLLSILLDDYMTYGMNGLPAEDEIQIIKNFYEQSSYYDRIKRDMDYLKGSEILRTERDRIGKTIVSIIEHDEKILNDIYNLCARKWFEKGFFKGSTTYFDQKWAEAKRKITWLCDTFEETLQRSVFLNSVQLVNFLSRIGEKDREIRVSGVPIKSKEKNNYVTYIERNLSTCYVFSKRGKTSSMKMMQNKNELVYVLKCLMESPLSDRTRADTIITYLNVHQQVEFSSVNNTARMNELCIIQWVIKECTKRRLDDKWEYYSYNNNENKLDDERDNVGYKINLPDDMSIKLSEYLRLNSRGMFGYWSDRQSFNKKTKKYEGNGIWIGKFGTGKVRITTIENVLERVELDQTWNINRWSEFMYTLREWLKIMGVDNSREKYATTNVPGDRVLNYELKKNSRLGAQIIFSKLDNIILENIKMPFVKIEFRNSQIQLKAESKLEGRYSNACNFQFNMQDNYVITDFKGIDFGLSRPVNNLLNNFIKYNGDLGVKDLMDLKKASREDPSLNKLRTERFLKRYMNQSLFRKDYVSSSKKQGELTEIIDEETTKDSTLVTTEADIDDFFMSIAGMAAEKLEDDLTSSDFMNAVANAIKNIEVLGLDFEMNDNYNMMGAKEVDYDYDYSVKSKIMDNLVGILETIIGPENIRRGLRNEKLITPANTEGKYIVLVLFELLGVKIEFEDFSEHLGLGSVLEDAGLITDSKLYNKAELERMTKKREDFNTKVREEAAQFKSLNSRKKEINYRVKIDKYKNEANKILSELKINSKDPEENRIFESLIVSIDENIIELIKKDKISTDQEIIGAIDTLRLMKDAVENYTFRGLAMRLKSISMNIFLLDDALYDYGKRNNFEEWKKIGVEIITKQLKEKLYPVHEQVETLINQISGFDSIDEIEWNEEGKYQDESDEEESEDEEEVEQQDENVEED